MTVLAAQIQKGYYNQAQALGEKAISAEFAFEIEGHEGLYLLCKQAPHALLGPQGEIELPGPMGDVTYQPQGGKGGFQGPISFHETKAGSVQEFMREVMANGGVFNATLYEGMPDRYQRAHKYLNCFFVPDQGDRDWENRSQVFSISGTLFGHYYGDVIEGNAP